MTVLHFGSAYVTPHGIVHRGKVYTCLKAISEQWFYKAFYEGEWCINVKYDPLVQDYLILNEYNDEYCSLVEISLYSGKELKQYQEIIELYKECKRMYPSLRIKTKIKESHDSFE